MLTFDDNGRSVLGTSPEAAAITLTAAGADIVGSNCGLGIDGIYEILRGMRSVTGLPLISQANAGLPLLIDGQTVFPGTPAEMTAYHDRLIALGVRVIGGCCGTTPAHIRAMKEALSGRQTAWQPPVGTTGADPPLQPRRLDRCRRRRYNRHHRRAHQSHRQETLFPGTAGRQGRLYPP